MSESELQACWTAKTSVLHISNGNGRAPRPPLNPAVASTGALNPRPFYAPLVLKVTLQRNLMYTTEDINVEDDGARTLKVIVFPETVLCS